MDFCKISDERSGTRFLCVKRLCNEDGRGNGILTNLWILTETNIFIENAIENSDKKRKSICQILRISELYSCYLCESALFEFHQKFNSTSTQIEPYALCHSDDIANWQKNNITQICMHIDNGKIKLINSM